MKPRTHTLGLGANVDSRASDGLLWRVVV